jgi:hypothetical protein
MRFADRLVGVPTAAYSLPEEESGMGVVHWKPSAFSQLVHHTELRDRFVEGSLRVRARVGGSSSSSEKQKKRPYDAVREAQERFLRLDRRLRSVFIKATDSDSLLPLMQAVEEVLRAFLQVSQRQTAKLLAWIMHGNKSSSSSRPLTDLLSEGSSMLAMCVPTTHSPWQCDVMVPHSELPAALRDALEAPLRRSLGTGTITAGLDHQHQHEPPPLLAFPLRNSPFFRLLVHGLAQYNGLRSRST